MKNNINVKIDFHFVLSVVLDILPFSIFFGNKAYILNENLVSIERYS